MRSASCLVLPSGSISGQLGFGQRSCHWASADSPGGDVSATSGSVATAAPARGGRGCGCCRGGSPAGRAVPSRGVSGDSDRVGVDGGTVAARGGGADPGTRLAREIPASAGLLRAPGAGSEPSRRAVEDDISTARGPLCVLPAGASMPLGAGSESAARRCSAAPVSLSGLPLTAGVTFAGGLATDAVDPALRWLVSGGANDNLGMIAAPATRATRDSPETTSRPRMKASERMETERTDRRLASGVISRPDKRMKGLALFPVCVTTLFQSAGRPA